MVLELVGVLELAGAMISDGYGHGISHEMSFAELISIADVNQLRSPASGKPLAQCATRMVEMSASNSGTFRNKLAESEDFVLKAESMAGGLRTRGPGTRNYIYEHFANTRFIQSCF